MNSLSQNKQMNMTQRTVQIKSKLLDLGKVKKIQHNKY